VLAAVFIWSGFLGFVEHLTATEAALIQTAVVTFGGGWALFLYRRTRRGQVNILITPNWRIASADGRTVLVVSCQFDNASKVAARRVEAALGVFTVSGFAEDGHPSYLLWATIPDLFLEVEGSLKFDGARAQFTRDRTPVWEPGDRVVTESALPGPPNDFLAVMVDVAVPRNHVVSLVLRLRHPRRYGLSLAPLRWSWTVLRFVDLGVPQPPPRAVGSI
jgi:hypothetical protein